MPDEAKPTDQHWYGALWNFLMAHKALEKASGRTQEAAPAVGDNSMVAKAAQEAGERMEAEKRARVAVANANRVQGPR